MTTDDEFSRYDVCTLASSCGSASDLLAQMVISEQDVTFIERRTVGQSSNEIWKRMRKGRLTASNFYRVYTKVETLKKNPLADCTKLVKSLLDPTDISHLPQIARGVTEEMRARETVKRTLAEHHTNMQVSECGLYLCVDQPYLGASPDGILTCSCCERALLEIKCPTNDLGALHYLDEKLQLKKKSNYYAQIQGQMAITGIHRTYFFIFYNVTQHHLQVIDFDRLFSDAMTHNLHHFYTAHIVPRLLSGPARKKGKKEIVVVE